MSLAILGGGPAGLAVGLYAKAARLEFDVYEAAAEPGGNCRTLRFGEFLVDTGAHRLHDRDPETTALARSLLGADLLHVDAPSRLWSHGRSLAFPLAPLDLVRHLPARTLAAIVRENVALRFSRRAGAPESFGEFARTAYGETLARLALLDYSRKLWGRDPDTLLPEIAGTRLARLDVRTFLLEFLAGRGAARAHLDGSFLYPRYGIGQLFSRAADHLGRRVHLRSPVVRIAHDAGRITAVEIRGVGLVEPTWVVNTLPIGVVAQLLDPAPPRAVLESARALRFRSLRLCIVMLARDRFSECASIYFPDAWIPFTRLYECVNRSSAMAPAGATALVLEVPCEQGDHIATLDDGAFTDHVLEAFSRTCGVARREIIGVHAVTLPNAYPVLERGARPHLSRLESYLGSFGNLQMSGRNASFAYSSIHDVFRQARHTVEAIGAQALREPVAVSS